MNGTSNSEPELRRLLPDPPGGTPPELRAAVLSCVTVELSRQRERRLTRRWTLGAVCLLLTGVLANVGVLQHEEQRFLSVCGPAPVSRSTADLFQAVAEVTDKETAARLQVQWLAVRASQPRDPDEFARLYSAQFQTLTDIVNWERGG